ncbi:NAD(P)-binding domain-containing protein [Candidimonas nitroreducens]|nr:NAD(P)-binding domain-containing protein [Candidimonas nitroreducens]
MKTATIGLGDAGHCYATTLSESGHRIFDICDSRPNTHIEEYAHRVGANLHTTPGPWLAETDSVISAAFDRAALDVARPSLAHMHKGAIYADSTTANPAELAVAGRVASAAAIHYIDVAITGTIYTKGAQAPLLCAGPNTGKLIEIMQSIGGGVSGGCRTHRLETRTLQRAIRHRRRGCDLQAHLRVRPEQPEPGHSKDMTEKLEQSGYTSIASTLLNNWRSSIVQITRCSAPWSKNPASNLNNRLPEQEET